MADPLGNGWGGAPLVGGVAVIVTAWLTWLGTAVLSRDKSLKRLDEIEKRLRKEFVAREKEQRESFARDTAALAARLDKLDRRLDEARDAERKLATENAELRAYVATLVTIMRERGMDPPPAPGSAT